jgi:hypothetical protein
LVGDFFAFYAGVFVWLFVLPFISSAAADKSYGTPVGDVDAFLDKLVSSYADWIASRTNEYLSMKNGMKFAISVARTRADRLSRLVDLVKRASCERNSAPTPASPV